jgi:hypothetical protein
MSFSSKIIIIKKAWPATGIYASTIARSVISIWVHADGGRVTVSRVA